jgi:hypothetical protein
MRNGGAHVSLPNEFEELRTDHANVWDKYKHWSQYTYFKEFYLDQPKHWGNIFVRFHNKYGGGKKNILGSATGQNIHDIWQEECVQSSKFCANSKLRSPSLAATECGVCRNTVREVILRLRRLISAPGDATKKVVDSVVDGICQVLPFYQPRNISSKHESLCEDFLDDTDGGQGLVRSIVKALAKGKEWPSAKVKSPTLQYEEAVCLPKRKTDAEFVACDAQGWTASTIPDPPTPNVEEENQKPKPSTTTDATKNLDGDTVTKTNDKQKIKKKKKNTKKKKKKKKKKKEGVSKKEL